MSLEKALAALQDQIEVLTEAVKENTAAQNANKESRDVLVEKTEKLKAKKTKSILEEPVEEEDEEEEAPPPKKKLAKKQVDEDEEEAPKGKKKSAKKAPVDDEDETDEEEEEIDPLAFLGDKKPSRWTKANLKSVVNDFVSGQGISDEEMIERGEFVKEMLTYMGHKRGTDIEQDEHDDVAYFLKAYVKGKRADDLFVEDEEEEEEAPPPKKKKRK